MEKALWHRAAVALLVAGSISGCAGGSSAGRGWSSRLMFWRNDAQGLNSSVNPDFSKNHPTNKIGPERGEIVERHTEMPKPEKGGWARFTAAVSGTGSKAARSVKSVFAGDNNAKRDSPAEWKDLDKPAGPALCVTLAQTMERTGNLTGAEKQYELALKADKNHLPALLGYARLKDRQGAFGDAIELYERASRAHPEEGSVLNDLALCLSRQGRSEEAAAKMAQAVKLNPERKLYRNNMAKLLVDVGEPQQAFEQLLVAHPAAAAHYNLGYLLAEKGEKQLAAYHFTQALALDASLTDAQRWLEVLQVAPSATQALPQNDQVFPPAAGMPPSNGAPRIERLAPDPATGPQWIEPQITPGAGAQYGPSTSTPLPQVLRPRSGPGPRYGMAPTGYQPPSQY